MKKATLVNAIYNQSSTVTPQGNRASIQPYLNKGYYIKEDRNGYWVLVKPATLIITLKDFNNIIHSFEVKEDVVKYYGKHRISKPLANTFINDAISGRIKFYMDNNGNYSME